MMLYLVKRHRDDYVDYDEMAGYVIRANGIDEVKQIIAKEKTDMQGWGIDLSYFDRMDITELESDGETKIILSDFKAG
jgi:hypothetical protein